MTAAPVLGIHGLRTRRLPETMRTGLVRPSAAWFLVGARSDVDELLATLAATVYLALGRNLPGELHACPRPGYYTEYLREHPEALPALVLFPDAPTGREVTHRYAWYGGPTQPQARPGSRTCRPSVTAPYTKVQRAGRTVPGGFPEVFIVGLAEVAATERTVDRMPRAPGWWSDHRPLRRAPADGDPEPVTKLAAFCTALGRHLLPLIRAAIDDMR